MASGPEHYAEAERLLASIGDTAPRIRTTTDVQTMSAVVALAQVHATLAHVAAVIDMSDLSDQSDWWKAVDDSPELQAKKSREYDRRQRESQEAAERDQRAGEYAAKEILRLRQPQDAPEPQDAQVHDADLPGGTCASRDPHSPHPWRNVEGTPLYCPGKVQR